MQCPTCQVENLPDSLFCESCGATLDVACPACGAGNRPGAKFCRKCRTSLGDAARAKAEPAPQAAAADGERRQLTVLFCDLVGSTEIATRLDAEDWHRISTAYQHAAARAVKRFGGHVDKFLGDGLVCFFGVPHAHEDDAERAVRAGLAIVEEVQALNGGMEHGVSLHVRVGMHTGPAVVAQGGGTSRDVFGDTPNVAARVQALAEPDGVLITAATHRLVAGTFVVDDRGAHTLRGIREAVTLYRVRQVSGVRSRLAAGMARGLTPFTGRDQERRLLMERWDMVREGEGQVVLVTGEAGIGKSRLVQQFKEDLGAMPYSWVECSGSPYYHQSPFYPTIDLLQHGFAWRGDESAEEKVAAIERALAGFKVPALQALPLIAQLLGLPVPAHYPPLLLSPEQQRKKLMATLVAWVFGVARLQPVVLVVEDLHWVDPSTLELLGLFSEQGATAPLLLVFTARPEFRAPWPLRAHHAQISLNRLSRNHVREMIVRVAAQLIPPGEMLEALATRTDGVPLFVEELTRAVLEAEGATIVSREIPATLQDSLMARLDRLGSAKDVAQTAAVIGREFSFQLLRAVSSLPEEELQTSLQRLGDAELVYARGFPPEATYSFKHGLIQETAYGSLLKSRRRELHRRVAELLAKTEAATPPAVLAYHWEAAGDAEAAVAAWQQAAEQAQRSAATSEAEAHYRRALAALAMLPDGPARWQLGLPLQVALFMLLIVTRGAADTAIEDAVMRAAALAERLDDATQAVLVLAGSWGAAHVRGEHRAAVVVARQMERLATRDGAAVPLVMAHMSLGSSLFHLGQLEASRVQHERVLALFNDDDFRWLPANPQALSLMYLAFIAWLDGRADTALARARELAAAAEQRGVLSDRALAELVLLTIAGLRRESAGMGEPARHLLNLCRDHDLPLYLAGAQVLGGWVMVCEEGAGAEGVALLRDGLRREGMEGGTKTFIAVHMSLLAEVYARNGAIGQAMTALDEAFDAIGDEEIWRADLLRVRGDLLLKTIDGHPEGEEKRTAEEAAERCYRDAIECAGHMGAKAFHLRAATCLGRLLHASGRSAEARALLTPVHASFSEGFGTRDLKEARALSEALARSSAG